MAYNNNPRASSYQRGTEGSSSSQLEAYSYYYQNVYSFGADPIPDLTEQCPPANPSQYDYDYYTALQQQNGQGGQCRNTYGVLPAPIPKTVGGRPRSPVQRVLRYRLDDNEAMVAKMNTPPKREPYNYDRRAKKRYANNYSQENYNLGNEMDDINTDNEANPVQAQNTAERFSIELQLNEAMFFDRLYQVGFTSSWYKLKKRDEEGTELICVVVEIIDANKKVYKAYGGYTAPIRAKEMAYSQAVKKLNLIIEEQEKQMAMAMALQSSTTATVPDSDFSTTTNIPYLVPNPLYNSAAKAQASKLQSYDPPVPSGNFDGDWSAEYDPVDFSYNARSRQPLPPGAEQEYFSEVSNGTQKQKTDYSVRQVPQHVENSTSTSSSKALTIDRPCTGRGDNETDFCKKAKDMGYVFRCLKLPPKQFFTIEYFGFQIEIMGILHNPTSLIKIVGSFVRDDHQARESAYAIALDRLEKIERKMKPVPTYDEDLEWLSPLPQSASNSSQKSHAKQQYESYASDTTFGRDILRKTVKTPSWDWNATENDMSILKCVPQYGLGRGRVKPKIDTSDQGGDILDHLRRRRDW